MSQIPLFYIEWDETFQLPSPPISETTVSNGELFIRKLVNASMMNNRIWEHISNETDEHGQSVIYVKPWLKEYSRFGEAMDVAVHEHYDIAEAAYEIEYYHMNGERFSLKTKSSYKNPMDIAQVLLDHYVSLNGATYEAYFALWDNSRHKVLLFLTDDATTK